MSKYVISYDIGTTGVKTCIFEIDKTIKLLGAGMEGYKLYVFPDGGAEQDPDEWWAAMCSTTRTALSQCDVTPDMIEGISFCSQAQGLVLVDKDGKPVHRAFSYMDQRATEQIKKGMQYGPQIAGGNIFKLIPSLIITGAASLSVKDPVWKYNWMRDNEPENFKRAYKWLDVKEYLICRMTGNCIMTRDSAFGTLLYDIREGHKCFSPKICKLLGVDMKHLPDIIDSDAVAGKLSKQAADELGLAEGTSVFGGGMDASLIGVGAGAAGLGDTHIYSGTSGWVSTVVDKSIVDTTAMMAAAVGVQNGRYNYFGELETAGKCLEWVKDHLALDEIGIYLEKKHVAESQETVYRSLYDYLSKVISETPAGSGGVVFTPWLHGNRCPFEDPNSRGMFFNISLETGKTELIRSVIEGVCFHMRWFIETSEKKVKTSNTIRFVGGGALSDVTCQILADITGRTIETVDSPQNVGAVGAAALMAVGLGIIDNVGEAKKLIPASKTFKPNGKNKPVYDRNYQVYKTLYANNKKAFASLNG